MGARQKKSKKPFGTKAERLLEEATFFLDICLGRHVGEALCAANWKVEFHLSHFKQNTPDEEWIPAVGARGWIVLTKDKGIRRKAWEREKVIAANVRMFTLASGEMTGEEMAQVYLHNGPKIGRFLKKYAAPFIASVSRSGIVPIIGELAGPKGTSQGEPADPHPANHTAK
jgi:PIN like domain